MRRLVDADRLYAVFEAADALLGARESEMLTVEEWDNLETAVAACYEPPPDEREETFSIENDDTLVRRVVPLPGRGDPYEHRCTKQVYDDVAYAVEKAGARSFTNEEVRAAVDQLAADEGQPGHAPFTQVHVAMAFLKERGCIVPAPGRRHVAATDYAIEDAMIEWHALREGAPGSG